MNDRVLISLRYAAGFVRCAAGVVALGGVVAIALARLEAPAAPTRVARSDVPLRVVTLPGLRSPGYEWYLDPATGGRVRFASPDGGIITHVACSPWVDDAGDDQFVALWNAMRSANWTDLHIIRGARHGAVELDRIPITAEVIFPGTPCWFPDRSTRVLLVGGDGLLYRHDFGEAADGPGGRFHLAPLPWRTEAVPTPPVQIEEIAWPAADAFRGLLFISLATLPSDPSRARVIGPRIWWVRLDDRAESVVAAGRLTRPDDGEADLFEERCPALAVGEGGSLLLAYLDLPPGRSSRTWRLRLARIESDPSSGEPIARLSRAETLAEPCALASPLFSAEGRRIRYVAHIEGGDPRLRSLAIPSENRPAAPGASRLTDLTVPTRGGPRS